MSLVKSNPRRPSSYSGGLLSQDPFSNFWDTNRRLMNLDRLFNVFGTELDMPPVNIKEEKDHYEIELAAPGLTKDHFEVELNDDLLTISASKEEKKEQKDDNYISKEFNYEAFSRAISIPDNVDTKKDIKAHYENGMLKIELFKKEGTTGQKSKKVKIS